MSEASTKAARKFLAIENAKYPEHLVPVERERWNPANWDDTSRVEVWRSREFLVQVFAEKDGAQRLTISRTHVLPNGKWMPGITWDDLQRLKSQCGRAERWAMEIYPADEHLVDVANMRHLWILAEAPQFAWRRRNERAAHP